MHIKDIEKLKDWLLKKLEPLCDADPAALAKYVVALLRKDKPKAALKELCIDQLEVFLAKETSGFVDQLFRSLDSESYLKGVTDSSKPEVSKRTQNDTKPSTGSAVPLSTSNIVDRRLSEDQSKKNEVDDEDRDFRRSRRGGGISGGRLRNDSAPTKRVVSIVTSSTGAGGGPSTGIGKKRRMETSHDNEGTNRRKVVMDHGVVDPVVTQSNVTSSSGAGQGGNNISSRRPIKERLGVRPDDWSDNRGRRHRRDHNSPSSRSSSTSGSGSDSSSDSDRRNRGRKRKRYTKTRSSSTEGRRRQRCKDYDEKGFCILGESCLYDHGMDPLVIGGNEIPSFPPPPLGLPPPPGMPPPGMPPPGMPLPPNARKPDLMLPPVIPNLTGSLNQPRGLLNVNDGYNPEDPALSSSKSSDMVPISMVPHLGHRLHHPLRGAAIPPPISLSAVPHQRIPFPNHPPLIRPPPPFPPQYHQLRPPFLGRPPGPSKPSDTLIIRKIPRDLNSITKLSSHFEKFGNIVNLKVRYDGDIEGALVQFSMPSEATKAHNSTNAVLGNRFIKVYYLKQNDSMRQPPSVDGQHETPLSTVSHSVTPSAGNSLTVVSSSVQSTTNKAHQPTPNSSTSPTDSKPNTLKTQPASNKPKSSNKLNKGGSLPLVPRPYVNRRQQRKTAQVTKEYLDLQKKTQELLQKQIQQQKLLISKLEQSGKQLSAEEKGKILKTLQTLSSNITKLKEEATATKNRADSANEATLADLQPSPNTNSLKQKADALRKEAHQLGLINSPSQPLPTSGRPHQVGHSSPDLRSRLDSKPRKILVIGVQSKEKLTTYFESFGDLEQVVVDPNNSNNLIFIFRNAYSATKAVKSSSVFNGKPLIMKWYTAKPRPTKPSSTLETVQSLPPNRVASHVSNQLSTAKKQISVEDKAIPITSPATLSRPDPVDLHLVEDSDDEEQDSERRSWKR